MRDDTIYEDEDVKEAIRRLPENLYNDRMFRIKRALDLSMKHQILPKEQWTKYEENKTTSSVTGEMILLKSLRKSLI
uniref:Cytochrome b-c1 complex subunit 7 n=1 Tax=Cebus imitator TaxID=2715852 RepID=A0A2K5QW73_CEBIM